MPLYTYVLTFKGATYVSQSSHSNFQGFIDWTDIPPNALPGLSPKMKKELQQNAYAGFVEVPNRRHVWRNTLKVRGEDSPRCGAHPAITGSSIIVKDVDKVICWSF